MPNRAAERVVNALNFNWPDSICHGNSQRRLKQWLANAIRDGYTPAEIDRLGAIMDIGPGSCMQWPSTTRGRNLKRLCILIYCVLLYHTFDETEQFKNQVIGWDKAATKRRTRRAMARAIHYAHHRDAWATDVTARCGGNVVRFYNQGDDQRLNLIDYTQQGWCLGMTTEWVIDHVRGDDFWAGHTTRAYERRYQMVMAAQELRIGGVAGSNLRDASKFRMRRAGMTRTDNIVLPRGATAVGHGAGDRQGADELCHHRPRPRRRDRRPCDGGLQDSRRDHLHGPQSRRVLFRQSERFRKMVCAVHALSGLRHRFLPDRGLPRDADAGPPPRRAADRGDASASAGHGLRGRVTQQAAEC
jgi:hypothetical protein